MHNDDKKSKFLNNPVRTVIIEDDNRPGAFPVQIPAGVELEDPVFFRDTHTLETPSVYSELTVRLAEVPPNGSTIQFTNTASPSLFSDFTLSFISSGPTPEDTSSIFYVDIKNPDLVSELQAFAGLVNREDIVGSQALQISRVSNKLADKISSIRRPLLARVNKDQSITITLQIPGTSGDLVTLQPSPEIYFYDVQGLGISTTSPTSFSGGRDTNVRYPYCVPFSTASESYEVIRRATALVHTGGIDVPTSGDARLLSVYSKGHPVYKGQNSIAPYNEAVSDQAFLGYSIPSGTSRPWSQFDPSDFRDIDFTTQGSVLGPGSDFVIRGSVPGDFDEPLRNKDKIVIDLEPTVSSTLSHQPFGPDNFPMAYFNFEEKKWDKIGLNSDLGSATNIQEDLDAFVVGFQCVPDPNRDSIASLPTSILNPDLKKIVDNISPSELGNRRITPASFGAPVSTYGFPYHPRFHATGSQQLPASNLIDRPFLVEKIEYHFSGSIETPGFSLQDRDLVGGVFFILNQRKGSLGEGVEGSKFNFSYFDGTGLYPSFAGRLPVKEESYTGGDPAGGAIPQTRQLSVNGPQVYVDTLRDLVTWGTYGFMTPSYSYNSRITSDWSTNTFNKLRQGFPHPAQYCDVVARLRTDPANDDNGLGGPFDLTVVADVRSPKFSPAFDVRGTRHAGATPSEQVYIGYNSITRNGTNTPTGRAYRDEFASSNFLYEGKPAGASLLIWESNSEPSVSPYVIRPGDNLVFGMQSSTGLDVNDGYTQKILPGTGKLILYGSYLRDNKPVHDIYGDQLGSEAIHATVPTGPWVLDRIESEPTSVYSGSMRSELVTGTMVTRRFGPNPLKVTDLNDLSVGAVRAIAASSYRGNLGQRGSFYRNLRLVDSEEQYYDSMQPNAFDALSTLSNGNNLGLSTLSPGNYYVPIRIPGENFYDAANPTLTTFLNERSNDTLIGSFPFEPKFSGIDREKSVSVDNVGERFYDTLSDGLQRPSGITFISGTLPNGDPGNLERLGGIRRGGATLSGFSPRALYVFAHPDDTNPVQTSWPGVFDLAPILRTKQTYAGNIPFLSVDFHFSRLMGCFGDGYLGLVQYEEENNFFAGYLAKQNYRGTRYGLINPTPLFSNATYNGTSYGQFRDMLEPRKYSRFSLRDNTLTDSAVEVVFIDNSIVELIDGARNNVTSGSATNSINVSPFCTSSLPYFDGEIRDRSLPLPEDLRRV